MTKVVIQMPAHAAEKLLKDWKENKIAVMELYKDFGIIDIKPTEPEDLNEQTKPASETNAGT